MKEEKLMGWRRPFIKVPKMILARHQLMDSVDCITSRAVLGLIDSICLVNSYYSICLTNSNYSFFKALLHAKWTRKSRTSRIEISEAPRQRPISPPKSPRKRFMEG